MAPRLCSAFLTASAPTSSSAFVSSTTSLSSSLPAPSRRVTQPLRVECKKKIQGVVVSASSDKTVAVEVRSVYQHPLYKKRIATTKRYQAHDPTNACHVNDFVTLAGCPPVSKFKRFVVVEVRPPRVAGAAARAAREAQDGSLPPMQSEGTQ